MVNKACIGSRLTSENSIECSGTVTCKRAKIKALKVSFSGSGSGDAATILDCSDIEGGGYNSLNFAEIDSENVTTMSVKLSQQSGKDAVILARSGSEVSVECIDACSTTEVLSFSGSNVSVTVTTPGGSSTTSGGGGSTDNVVDCVAHPNDPTCPIIQTSSSDCEDIALYKHLQMTRDKKYMHIINDMTNDEDKNIAWNDLMHDIYEINNDVLTCDDSSLQCESTILNKDAQCYAADSCKSATINQTEQNKIFNTKCYGDSSCQLALLNNKYGTIECDGKASCFESDFIRAKFVTCRGYGACQSGEGGIHTNALNCEGSFSCAQNTIVNKLAIKCVANRACFESSIWSGNNIMCDGSYSCFESQMNTSEAVKCTASFSCANSQIHSRKYVYADGDNACTLARIYAPAVRGYGYKSLSQAIIDSNHLGKLSMKLYGNLTGYNARVICRNGDTCSLKCEATGCKNLMFDCEPLSNCQVTPTACTNVRNKTNSNPKMINGINCPELVNGVGNKKKKKNLMYSQIIVDNNNKKHENSIKLKSIAYAICIFTVVICVILIGVVYYSKWQYKQQCNHHYESII